MACTSAPRTPPAPTGVRDRTSTDAALLCPQRVPTVDAASRERADDELETAEELLLNGAPALARTAAKHSAEIWPRAEAFGVLSMVHEALFDARLATRYRDCAIALAGGDARSAVPQLTILPPERVEAMAVSANGRVLVLVDWRGHAGVLGLTGLGDFDSLEAPSSAHAAAVAPTGERIFFANRSGTLVAYSRGSARVDVKRELGSAGMGTMAVGHHGRRLFLVYGSFLHVLDAVTLTDAVPRVPLGVSASEVDFLAVAPDEASFAIATTARDVRVGRVDAPPGADESATKVVYKHANYVTALAFDGELVVSCRMDGTCAGTSADGKAVFERPLQGAEAYSGTAKTAAIDREGITILDEGRAFEGPLLRFWSLDGKDRAAALPIRSSSEEGAPRLAILASKAVLSRGRAIVLEASLVDEPVSLAVVDVATGVARRRIHSAAPVHKLAITSDARMIAVANRTSHTVLWSTLGEARAFDRGGHERSDGVFGVAMDAKGTRVASLSTARTIVWDPLVGRKVRELPGGSTVAFGPDGDRIAIAREKAIQIEEGPTMAVNRPVSWLTFSSDGKRLVSFEPPLVNVFGADSGKLLHTLGPSGDAGSKRSTARKASEFEDPPVALAYAANVDIVCGIGQRGKLWAWNTATGESVSTPKSPGVGNANALAVTPDGRRWAIGDSRGLVLVIGGEQVEAIQAHDGSVRTLAISEDGLRIVSGGDEGSVQIHDARAGKRLLRLFSGSPKPLAASLLPTPEFIVWESARSPRRELAWLSLDEAGQVDGTLAAGRWLRWRTPNAVLPGPLLWSTRESPGQLERVLRR
jgi:hypothetical protein